MYKYSWIALQLMMKDASWYDIKSDSEGGGAGKADSDGIIWVQTNEQHEKVKQKFGK